MKLPLQCEWGERDDKEGINKEFTEKLIDYIGFRRLDKDNSYNENRKRQKTLSFFYIPNGNDNCGFKVLTF